MFTRFLPEPMVDEVLARTDGDARIHPELLTGTVLFGDLRGFTSFAEGRPVDDVIEAINTYLTLMTDAVLDHGGTLVSYMGDGIMAAFGAPVANDEHADLALAAARAMAGEQLATFNAWLSAAGVEQPLRMGIGINSGPVLSASVGSPRRLDYTVIGDTMNTASRIESMTKELDHAVLFSEPTRDALREFRRTRVARRVRDPRAQREDRALGARRRGAGMTTLDDEIRALRERVAELETSEAGRERAETIQDALYRIAETASTAEDMQDFYARDPRDRPRADVRGQLLHRALRRRTAGDQWPYYVDEVDEDWPDPNVWEPMGTGRRAGSRRTRCVAASRADERPATRAIWSLGRDRALGEEGEDWLGVPLSSRTDARHPRRPDLRGRPALPAERRRGPDVRRPAHRAGARPRPAIDETRQRNAELGLINDVQQGLAANLDMQAMYDLVGDRCRRSSTPGRRHRDPGRVDGLIHFPYAIEKGNDTPTSRWRSSATAGWRSRPASRSVQDDGDGRRAIELGQPR